MQNSIYDQNGGKMAKIDMTKTAEKPYPLGPHRALFILLQVGRTLM